MRIPERLEPLVEEGLIDHVICQLMSGKEATIYIVHCGEEVRCAKVYKDSNKRNFQHRACCAEARKIKNNRRTREDVWQGIEVDMLCKLATAGIRVPKFYNFFAGVLLMELITDAQGNVAPRLSDMQLTPEQAREYYKNLIGQTVRMLYTGVVHGDLSPYNVLIGERGPVIIDLPQAVNATDHYRARHIIKRDIDHLTAYFSRFAPELARSDYADEIWSYCQYGKLQASAYNAFVH